MQRVARTPLSVLLCTLGLGLMLLGWGGAWGSVYGQTAGPTPTIDPISSPLTLVKSVTPNNGVPNEELTYTILIRNNQSAEQTNVVFSDRILDFLEIVSVSSTKGAATVNGQDVRVDIGTLAPGETATVTIVARIRQSALNGDTGVNIAHAISDQSSSSDSNPVAISVGQRPPADLPNTGSGGAPNPWLIALGFSFLAGGGLLAFRRARTQA